MLGFSHMDQKALTKAKGRLRTARQQLENAENAKTYEQFSDSWYLFLVAAKNVYTTLEQGAKTTPQSRQWFGAKKHDRKTDPLLQYLFQARDDDEHGLADVTKLDPGGVSTGKLAPGFSNDMAISASTDAEGNLTIRHLASHDGLPILIENIRWNAVLLSVTGRGGISYNVPDSHLGQPIEDQSPANVGRLGTDYLGKLLSEAEGRAV